MAEEFRYLRFERHHFERGDVLEVVIDRPGDDVNAALNAVDGVLHEELAHVFAQLQTEHEARAVLLSARGRAFCAGGDFDWFPVLQDPDALEPLRVDARNIVYDLLDVPLPVVCALNGHAMGLGATVALLCDVIVMARSATIGDPHVQVGLVAGDGGTLIWPLAVGPARAKQYLLTGDPVPAEEAERIGLVNRVCDDDRVHEEALAMARRLAAGAPLALRYTKAAVNASLKAEAARAFDQAVAYELVTFRSEDHREALAALAEKRVPHFRGR